MIFFLKTFSGEDRYQTLGQLEEIILKVGFLFFFQNNKNFFQAVSLFFHRWIAAKSEIAHLTNQISLLLWSLI